MPADGEPLVQMVDQLGLRDDMTAQVRTIIDGLSPDVVAGIRQSMLAIDGNVTMPISCTITDSAIEAGTARSMWSARRGGFRRASNPGE